MKKSQKSRAQSRSTPPRTPKSSAGSPPSLVAMGVPATAHACRIRGWRHFFIGAAGALVVWFLAFLANTLHFTPAVGLMTTLSFLGLCTFLAAVWMNARLSLLRFVLRRRPWTEVDGVEASITVRQRRLGSVVAVGAMDGETSGASSFASASVKDFFARDVSVLRWVARTPGELGEGASAAENAPEMPSVQRLWVVRYGRWRMIVSPVGGSCPRWTHRAPSSVLRRLAIRSSR